MKILHLSDTHGLHRKIKDLPNADVIAIGHFTILDASQPRLSAIMIAAYKDQEIVVRAELGTSVMSRRKILSLL